MKKMENLQGKKIMPIQAMNIILYPTNFPIMYFKPGKIDEQNGGIFTQVCWKCGINDHATLLFLHRGNEHQIYSLESATPPSLRTALVRYSALGSWMLK